MVDVIIGDVESSAFETVVRRCSELPSSVLQVKLTTHDVSSLRSVAVFLLLFSIACFGVGFGDVSPYV